MGKILRSGGGSYSGPGLEVTRESLNREVEGVKEWERAMEAELEEINPIAIIVPPADMPIVHVRRWFERLFKKN